jgi:hypothetical protein
MSMRPTTITDSLDLSSGRAAASQSCLVPGALAAAPASLLVAIGEAYKDLLGRLPVLAIASRPDGGHYVGPALVARRLPFISFAPPYLAAARGGRELRYPIIGGLMTRGPGGHLAFGLGPEGAYARLWVEVAGFRPRLGLGPLYILTQAQIHRLLTVTFLRRLAPALAPGDGTLLLPHRGG